jgi:hypothetical protein
MEPLTAVVVFVADVACIALLALTFVRHPPGPPLRL